MQWRRARCVAPCLCIGHPPRSRSTYGNRFLVTEVARELAAVEKDVAGTWVAVLAEPAASALMSDVGRPKEVDDNPRVRCLFSLFSEHAIIDLCIETTLDGIETTSTRRRLRSA